MSKGFLISMLVLAAMSIPATIGAFQICIEQATMMTMTPIAQRVFLSITPVVIMGVAGALTYYLCSGEVNRRKITVWTGSIFLVGFGYFAWLGIGVIFIEIGPLTLGSIIGGLLASR